MNEEKLRFGAINRPAQNHKTVILTMLVSINELLKASVKLPRYIQKLWYSTLLEILQKSVAEPSNKYKGLKPEYLWYFLHIWYIFMHASIQPILSDPPVQIKINWSY